VAALLPRHALYTSFLPAAAEAAIAQVHATALVLREVLEDAGLRYSHHINVEDGGPILEAEVDDLPQVPDGDVR
jgi:arginine N-succinyltransferase